MGKIITLTVNPAIDLSVSVPGLVPEKKLKCTDEMRQPGGGGINVSRAIKRLGGDSIAIYMKGGANGNVMEQLLRDENITTIPVPIANNTRENITVLDESSNLQYRFGMPGPVVNEREWNECLELINDINDVEFLIASGSLAPGMPADFYGKVAELAKKKNAKLIVDTSGEELKIAVTQGVYLLKPNLAELAFLTGKEEIMPSEIVNIAREIIAKNNCSIILLSMGAAGAMLITAKEVQHISAPGVKRKSTVGAGDSMVAGVVASLAEKKDIVYAAQFGVACGTAATMNPGTQLFKKEDVLALMSVIRPH